MEITGVRESGVLIHRVTLGRVNNPSTLANIFSASTYTGNNVDNIICSGQTQVNLLDSAFQNCNLKVDTDHVTKQYDAVYHFGFTCPNVIRNNSAIYIRVPSNYAFNNVASLPCWADFRSNLLTDMCSIKYTNGTFYIEVLNVIINKNEKTIGVSVKLNNPVTTGPYSFDANLTIRNYTYGVTTVSNISIVDASTQNISSIELVNMPKEDGVDACYFLKVPTSMVGSTLDFGLPAEF